MATMSAARPPVTTVRITLENRPGADDPFWAVLLAELGAVGRPAHDGSVLVALHADDDQAVDLVCRAIAEVDLVDRDSYQVCVLQTGQPRGDSAA